MNLSEKLLSRFSESSKKDVYSKLNDLLHTGDDAIDQLIKFRVPCSKYTEEIIEPASVGELKDHPKYDTSLSVLGLINMILDATGNEMIAWYDDDGEVEFIKQSDKRMTKEIVK